jgi:hypothetical protein
MGLDQYLSAKKYVSGADHSNDTDKNTFAEIAKALKVSHLFITDNMPSAEVTIKVGQWRKANQIHNWFVNNVQGGEDDCRSYYVSKENLETLLDLCRQVYAKRDNAFAEEVLPTSSGFFFGDTDVNEQYYNDVLYTALTLEQLLNDPTLSDTSGWAWEFSYQSSW